MLVRKVLNMLDQLVVCRCHMVGALLPSVLPTSPPPPQLVTINNIAAGNNRSCADCRPMFPFWLTELDSGRRVTKLGVRCSKALQF